MDEREPRDEPRRLAGSSILVAGGAGNVGRQVVAALLLQGASVVVPSRSPQRLERLRAGVDADARRRLHAIVGDVASERDAGRLRDEVLAVAGRLDGVVASLGRFVPSPTLRDATSEQLSGVLRDYVLAHLVVAQTFLPALREGGAYLFVNGPSAFQPFPGGTLVSIATAAQAMLARAWMAEVQDAPVRVNELVLYTAFGWGEEAERRNAIRSEDVARFVAWLVSDRASHVRGQTIHLRSPEQLDVLES